MRTRIRLRIFAVKTAGSGVIDMSSRCGVLGTRPTESPQGTTRPGAGAPDATPDPLHAAARTILSRHQSTREADTRGHGNIALARATRGPLWCGVIASCYSGERRWCREKKARRGHGWRTRGRIATHVSKAPGKRSRAILDDRHLRVTL